MNQNQNKNMTDQEVTKEFVALTKLERKNAASIPRINKLREQIQEQIEEIEAQLNRKIHAMEAKIYKLQEPNRQLQARRSALISKMTQAQLLKFNDKI